MGLGAGWQSLPSNTETVTLVQYRDSGNVTTTIPKALPRQIKNSRNDTGVGVRVPGRTRRWNIAAEYVTGQILQGDTIEDASGNVWFVMADADLLSNDTRWVADCSLKKGS